MAFIAKYFTFSGTLLQPLQAAIYLKFMLRLRDESR